MIPNAQPDARLIEDYLPGRAHFTPAEVARFLQVSPRHIYELIAEGAMPAKEIGRVKRIPRDLFCRWYLSADADPFS